MDDRFYKLIANLIEFRMAFMPQMAKHPAMLNEFNLIIEQNSPNNTEPHMELIKTITKPKDTELNRLAKKLGWKVAYNSCNNMEIVNMFSPDAGAKSENFYGPLAEAAAMNFLKTLK